MKKTNKKGFTLVELLVVIAIVAILATVAIIGYTSFTNKAHESNDRTLVAQLNIATERATGKYVTMHEVATLLEEHGFDVSLIKATAKDHAILWDMEAQEFFYVEDDERLGANSWIVSDKVSDKYSTYYIGTNEEPLNTTLGFDAGNVADLTVNFKGNNNAVIRMNGGTLNIGTATEIATGRVNFYGVANDSVVYTADHSFHVYGQIANVVLEKGHTAVEEGGLIAISSAATGVTLEVSNTAIVYIPEDTQVGDICDEVLASAGYEVKDNKIEAKPDTQEKNSYKIGSKAELIQFRNDWNAGNILAIVPFVLTADIDISGTNWVPIGNWKHPFNGTFDGNGHTISGLTAVGTLGADGVYNIGGTIGFGECFGFFGIVGEGNTEIKDLAFTDVKIDLVNGANVGAVIGFAPNLGKEYDGDKIDSVGALTLSDVTVSGSIKASKHVGGLVGDSRTTANVTFENCVNNANITATPTGFTGGIIGYANVCDTLTFDNCINNGDITLAGSGPNGVGGLCSTVNAKKIVVTNCENNGNILSTGSVAGLINAYGSTKTETLEISNSKVAGIIKTTGNNNVDVLYIVTNCTPTLSENTFAGIVECAMGYETTKLQANLNDAVAPAGYAIAAINKAEEWKEGSKYNDKGETIVWYESSRVHPVGYVTYNTAGEWTQIENTNVEYMEVGNGYYVFNSNGDIYARYTEAPTTDYRSLSQHPNNGQ